MSDQRARQWLVGTLAAILCALFPAAAGAQTVEDWPRLLKQYKALYEEGKYREAEPVARQLLALAPKFRPDKPAVTAIWLNNVALLNDNLGHYAEAERLYKQAIEIDEKVYGPNHLEMATDINNLAEVYRKQGRYAEAEPLYKRALRIVESRLSPDDPDIALNLNNLALLYDDQARYAEAEPLYKRALAIREKAWGSEHPRVATTLSNLAVLYDNQGRYDEAERAARRSLAIREKKLGPAHPDLIGSLNNLACACANKGRYAEAESFQRRAMAIAEKTFGPEHPKVATSLSNLALRLRDQGNDREAEPLYQRALAIREKVLGAQSAEVALILSNLACLYGDHGRYAEAESLHKRALAIREKALGPDHPDVATSLNNLAHLYDNQNRHAEAESLHRRALALRRKALGPEHDDVAASLNNLAEVYRAQSRYAEAAPLYEQSLAIWKKKLGPDHPDVAIALNNLALLYDDQRQYDKAEPLYKQALALSQKAFGPDHPAVATRLHNLAFLYHQQGRDAEAEPLIRHALAIRDRGQIAPGNRYHSRYLRAEVQWALGRKTAAVTDLKQAMELAEQQRGQVSGAERERSAYFSSMSYAFETMVRWQRELGDLGEALAAIERGRARSLVDQMETHGIDLLAGVPAEEARKLRDRQREAESRAASLQRQWQVLEQLKDLSAEERRQKGETLQSQLRQARIDYVSAYADIRNASPAYRLAVGQDRKPVSLRKLQTWVDGQNALLVEYLLGVEGGYVLVIPAGGKPHLETLRVDTEQAHTLGLKPGPLTERQLAEILSNRQGTGVLRSLAKSAEAPLAREARSRLAALWPVLVPEPERTALTHNKFARLVVIPDGGLSQLPFETLVVAPTEEPRFLLDAGPPIEYAPSATILLNLAGRRLSGETARHGVLTMGDPQYPRSAVPAAGALAELAPRSRYATLGGRLAQLPYTRWETAWVAEMFGEKGMEVVQLQGVQATEANLRSRLAGRRVLHLACHGLVDQSYGNLFGALALTPGSDAANTADDGFLTLAEIYALNLQTAELAILSACETNYGPQQRGEGVWALSRGFLVAGARRVVASNWLVDDEAAASLVSLFCGNLAAAEKAGRPVDYAEALAHSKRWVRNQEKWRSPYYWGTFVLIGPK